MNKGLHLSLIAALTSMLAAAQLLTVFATLTYLFYAGLIVIMVAGASIAVRALRGPLWAQVTAMLVMLLVGITWFFPSGSEIAGIVPTLDTFRHFGDLLAQAGDDIAATAPPVPDRPGLLFIASVGLGIVAVMIDLFAVGMRRPALAGLPILAIYAVPVAIKDGGLPFIPFTLGAIGFLWLLMTDSIDRVRRFGRRFTGDGRDIDLWEPSPLASAGRRLALVGVALSIVLTAIVPGTTSGLLDRLGTGPGDGSCATTACQGGGSTSVNLFSVLEGELRNARTAEMVVVKTDDPNPYYLRLATAEQASPDGFSFRMPTSGQPVGGDLSPGLVTGPTYHATVTITSLQMNLAPIFLQPVAISDLAGSWIYDPQTSTVFSRGSDTKGKEYNVDYIRPDYSVAQLDQAQPLAENDPIRRQYTRIPSVPEVESIVAAQTKNATTEYQKAKALYEFFSASNGFRYDLQTLGGTSSAKIVNFLHNKVGFCEQYAAALAWLARTAGLPARVAFGFTHGESRGDGVYSMTNLNLHTWTEIYFSGIGWVPFDATPAVQGSVTTGWAGSLSTNGNGGSGPAETEDPARGGQNGASSSANPGNKDLGQEGGGGASTPVKVISMWPTWVAFGLGVLILVLLTPTLMRRRLRNRRKPRLDPVAAAGGQSGPGVMAVVPDNVHEIAREDAHQTWDELLDTMVDFSIDPDPADSPRTTIERLIVRAELYQEAAKSGRRLGQAEERARYARTTVTDVDLDTELAAVRAGIVEQATRSARLWATLAPRSVLLRWRAAAVQATTRVIGRTNQAVDAMVRLLSVRRLVAGWLARRADS
jgi:hypothetical protein